MKRKTERQKAIAHFLVGAGYGGLLGLLTGNILVAIAGAWTGTVVMAWVWAVSLSVPVAMFWTIALVGLVGWVGSVTVAVARSGSVAVFWSVVWSVAWIGSVAVAWALKKIAESKNISPEELIDEHINWLISLFQKFRLFFNSRNYAKTSASSHGRKRAWDVQLVVSFAHELAEVFPEEWDEWQHWISDMMDLRTRMQSKSMNHHLVSLITFYRIICFALYIGIDKVFILVTRRATR